MSAVRAFQPARVQQNPLSLVVSKARVNSRISATVTIGAVIIVLLGLLLNVMTAQGAYEMANLKNQTKELNTTAQMLQEQVGSLGSNQNLEQAAHDLGMISNSNPVFLSIGSQKVFGKPKAAQVGSSLAGNLVANSALSAKTNVKALDAKAQALAAAVAAKDALKAAAVKPAATEVSNVAAAKAVTKKVSLPSSGIPGSPTH